jgi:phosphate starvation-inducible PhoH-like protein
VDTQSPSHRVELSFSDNRLVPLLYGEHDTNLTRIEHQLGVNIASRGNTLTITGSQKAAAIAEMALVSLWNRLQDSLPINNGDVDAAMRMARELRETGLASGNAVPDLKLKTRRRSIAPRTPKQAEYLKAMEENDLVFALGPAGTGKTYLAVAQAVAMMQAGQIERLVLSRPAVEAGERLGFLPGDLREKIDPYLRPIFDALNDLMPSEIVEKRLTQGLIEVAPLAFMRGRTLANAFVVLDEAQNTTPVQMKMVLTRLGENSRMVVTGDLTQVDLPNGTPSGMRDALETLCPYGQPPVEGVAVIEFGDTDVVRHPLVARIVQAYERRTRDRTQS